MTPAQFRAEIIEPGAAWLETVTGQTSSLAARRFLLAAAYQESNLEHRFQVLNGGGAGPARSWWQGEQTGGMVTVLTSPNVSASIRSKASAVCSAAHVRPEAAALWRALEGHDRLAYAMARLLLLTEPKAISETQDAAWSSYLWLWRPGKPHIGRWPGAWAAAVSQYP